MKKIITLLLLTVFAWGCGKNQTDRPIPKPIIDGELRISANLQVKGVSGTALLSDSENAINKIDVFSFALKPGETDYTFETIIHDLTPTTEGDSSRVVVTLNGSLPRVIYYIANGTTKIPFINTLTPTTTASQFETSAIIQNTSLLEPPLTLVSKVELTNPLLSKDIMVKMTHTAARLDIVNKYNGLTIDRSTVRNAYAGSYLMSTDKWDGINRMDMDYDTNNPIYIYQTAMSTLAIYCTVDGISAVFDIPLANIKSATKYTVTLKGKTPSGSLDYKVETWTSGDVIDSTPDWK